MKTAGDCGWRDNGRGRIIVPGFQTSLLQRALTRECDPEGDGSKRANHGRPDSMTSNISRLVAVDISLHTSIRLYIRSYIHTYIPYIHSYTRT